MNILTESQVSARQLKLPGDGLLSGVAPEFIQELQSNGTFIEYNQQVIISAGEPLDYVLCIVAGEAKLSRTNENYGRSRIGSLGAGQWFGEIGLFVRLPSREELFAAGDVIVWTIPTDALRDLFFQNAAAVQFLYNIGVSLAQRLSVQTDSSVAVTTATASQG
jgi:CRP-like cAMP-binding protein